MHGLIGYFLKPKFLLTIFILDKSRLFLTETILGKKNLRNNRISEFLPDPCKIEVCMTKYSMFFIQKVIIISFLKYSMADLYFKPRSNANNDYLDLAPPLK